MTLSKDDVAALIRKAAQEATGAADANRALTAARNCAEGAIAVAQKTLEAYSDRQELAARTRIEAAVVELQTFIAGDDCLALEAGTAALNTALQAAEADLARPDRSTEVAPDAREQPDGFPPERD